MEVLDPISLDNDNKSGKTAIIVAHGIGQQFRFETMAKLCRLLTGPEGPTAKVRQTVEEEKNYPRIELNISDKDVDIYEIYWAPFTEGKVNILDSIKFLFDSGKNGINFALKGYFHRFMFGNWEKFSLNRTKTISTFFLIILLFSFILTTSLLLALKSVKHFFICIQIIAYSAPGDIFPQLLERYSYFSLNLWNLLMIITGIAGYIGIYILYKILIKYVGDLTAYISSHKVNKFHVVREQIQEKAYSTIKAVYSAKSGDNFSYDRIIITGHSLGSVIVYDALNAIINYDLCSKKLDVVKRSKSIITFGSPLDKTAFIFRSQLNNLPVREALSVTVQPLISEYKNRPDEWINIHSKADFVSGPLNYYDNIEEQDSSKAIQNIIDDKAKGIWAHNSYWDNDILKETILKSIK